MEKFGKIDMDMEKLCEYNMTSISYAEAVFMSRNIDLAII